MKADRQSAWVLEHGSTFFREPAWMKQFRSRTPSTMTYRLQDGVLEVNTSIENMSAEPMPVSVGFHPYLKLTDSTRDEWVISVPAKTHWLLAQTKVPTGETEPIERLFPDPQSAALKDYNLDDVFSDLERDGQGRADAVEGKTQRLEIAIGPNFRSVIVWAPHPAGGRGSNVSSDPPPPRDAATPTRRRQDPNFICFEPMAAIVDAVNLAHGGLLGASVHSTRRHMGSELLDQDERVYSHSVISDDRPYVRSQDTLLVDDIKTAAR